MFTRKLPLCIILCLVFLIVASVLVKIAFFSLPETAIIINCPTEISDTVFHPGNNRQREANVWLGCYDGQIYYFGGNKDVLDKTEYDRSLFVFQDGELVEVTNLWRKKDNISILCIIDKYIYYRESETNNYRQQKLYAFNLETMQESLLYCGEIYPVSSLYFGEDGSVYFPLMPVSGEAAQFVHIVDQDFLGVGPLTDGYPLGTHVYHVVSEYSDVQVERIIKTTTDSDVESEEVYLEQAYNRSIIPYKNGLLVHNEGLNSLLYRIDPDGCVTELFSIPCMSSKSAVNIHETDAYISVLRYEKYGEKGMLRYENDSLEGTYRINLIDGSVEKINDICFDAIYNFDDTCFYCCDSTGNIYKMEFDGTTSQIMLLSSDG